MNESSSSKQTKNTMPTKDTYYNCNELENSIISLDLTNQIITSISSNLEDLIIENLNDIYQLYVKSDIFFLNHIPQISIEDYIKRILKYTQMNISSLILAIIYIDKMCEKNSYILCFNNIHRLILSSCLLSIKFNEDITFHNDLYARISGESVENVNKLEYELYVLLNFSLFVDYNYYEKYFEYFSQYSKYNSLENNINKLD
jgi:hypothetical protein